MGMNIKNERVHALARRAAEVTGQSQTSAIEQALVLLLREHDADPVTVDRDRRLRRLVDIGSELRDSSTDPAAGSGPRRVEDLYDERTGLPR